MFGISYWVIPVFSGFVWLGTLLGMLLFWTVHEGSPHITPMASNQHIAYISDIGAHQMQPLFIAGGTVTVVTFTSVFVAERWLRHRGRLAENTSLFQKLLSAAATIFAVIGMVGLIILTCLNDVKHHVAHDTCLVIFMYVSLSHPLSLSPFSFPNQSETTKPITYIIHSAGYIISAIFICWEYQRLGIHHRQYRVLRLSFWIKLAFIFVELGLAIAFGVLGDREEYNSAAICEWVIALIYAFYVWSFAIDFIPAVKTKDGWESRETDVEAATATAMEMQQHQQEQQQQQVYGNGNGNGVGNGYQNGTSNGRVVNGVHYPNAPKPVPVEPSRNF